MVAESRNSFALAFVFSNFPKGNLTRETVMCPSQRLDFILTKQSWDSSPTRCYIDETR